MTNALSSLARSSFMETIVRVPLLEAEPVPGRAGVYRFRTFLYPEDGNKVDAAVTAYWPSPPEDGTCAQLWAMLAYDDRSEVVELTSSRDEAELAWGHVSDQDYLERNQSTTPMRARCRGLCISSNREYFILNGHAYLNGANRDWSVKVNVNRTSPRWAKFSTPKVGEVVGVRGRVETIASVPAKTIILTMESFSAADPGRSASVPEQTTKTRSSRIDEEWMAARERAIAKRAAATGNGGTATEPGDAAEHPHDNAQNTTATAVGVVTESPDGGNTEGSSERAGKRKRT